MNNLPNKIPPNNITCITKEIQEVGKIQIP